MTNDLTYEVKSIGSLNFEGNIIPVEWFNHIRLPNKKPDLISIFLLSDIIYWYRPTTVRDEISGKVVGYRKKFKADLLQKGYSDLEALFGLTKDQIKKSLQRLEELNLVKRVFRNIKCNGSSLANVMFIQIFPNQISKITEKTFDMGKNTHTSEHTYPDIRVNKPTPPSINTHTYTETTTKTTTKNSLSPTSTVKDNNISKEYEREKEMINIWDKEIRAGERPSVNSKVRLVNLKKVLEEYFEDDLDNWKTYCLNIKNCNFLMGGGANHWKADLTWATKQENLIRVLEGYYYQKEKQTIEKNINENDLEEKENISVDPIWNVVKEKLKFNKGESTYKSWFKKLDFRGYDNNKVILTAPSRFIKDWILEKFSNDIIGLFKETEINIKEIEIFVQKEEVTLV